MPTFELPGQTGTYLFNPDKQTTVLKQNGKFNSVYLGIEESTKQKVVIKHLNPALSDQEHAIERFKAEHFLTPNHVRFVSSREYLQFKNQHFIIRDYVEGIELLKICKDPKKRNSFGAEFFVRCMIGALTALEQLHENDIVHGDIRPSNFILAFRPGTKAVDMNHPDIKLIDLGLARKIGETKTKKIPFALVYSPPEQVLNHQNLVNQTSDLYALGIALYEILSGDIPFKAMNPELIMNLQLNQPLEADPAIPEDLFKIILKATSKFSFPLPPAKYPQQEVNKKLLIGQNERYQSANEFKTELKQYLEKEKKKKRFFGLFGY
jgi:serine/threonine protein kinase